MFSNAEVNFHFQEYISFVRVHLLYKEPRQVLSVLEHCILVTDSLRGSAARAVYEASFIFPTHFPLHSDSLPLPTRGNETPPLQRWRELFFQGKAHSKKNKINV